jgi:hypothetical protein
VEMVTLEIDTGQVMVKIGGLIKKGDKICYLSDTNKFFLAPFSGKVMAIFEETDNISLIVKSHSLRG